MSKEVNELIKQAAIKAKQETDDEPEPGLTSEIEWPVEVKIGRGLEGAIATTTKIGYVNGAKGWLVYQGYNCFDLAEKSNFEETCYLLLFGKLPTDKELRDFTEKLTEYRHIPEATLDVLQKVVTPETHPMSALATGVSILGNLDSTADDTSVEAETDVSIKLIAQLATLAGAIARIRHGKDPVDPDPELSHAGNFLSLMTGQKPDEVLERIMDVALILHADHGMNASTFTTMVVNSSLSDMYSSVVAGIGSLKGPLHGGANERVLYDLQEIGSADNVESWFKEVRETKRRVMGFGHRVYKAYDPRARILGPIAKLMTDRNPKFKRLYETAIKLEEVVTRELGAEKKIFPNVDFYSGTVYRAMGIEIAMFTPIFAVSRIAGWTARALEYLADNRLFRPRAVYTGPIKAEYVPIDKRS
ncbi:citrate synthase/methylcitrate synthase [candidate division KSB1 bacterium]|nr:citrate synthase/methylcitrate synthase [candidate division KSB1 bacterium]NIR72571.1 citrate synthase/methylcitrate synthase [candidate division KSB1 bacterium]NIS27323.1 citrate synthase/methylcitrate synthase [candidate division KSB1 bacterium]NIT73533.1 citrate synthase/methylcitrate synthase [candidate division KSB1 bacterium]NIU28053.1 citrate synthase/methylcitrate synthase [candidate division KSB1 bacterium]